MVHLLERPVTAREAEGRVQTFQLLRWMQYSKYVPSTAEGRLLQVGLDELFGRTIDMTTLSVAFSLRLWTGWMKMSFTRRWMLPIYFGLVIADRRRAMNVMKLDSTYATLLAISNLDSPMGREAKRLVDKSKPRLDEFKKNPETAKMDFRVQRYFKQIFYWYGVLGPVFGAAVSHLMLWTTLHETLAGSAFWHTIAPGELDDFSIIHEIQQTQILKDIEKRRHDHEGSKSRWISSGRTSPKEFAEEQKKKEETMLNEEADVDEKQSSKKNKIVGETKLSSSPAPSSLSQRQMNKIKKKNTNPANSALAARTTILASIQLNFRWYKWEMFDLSYVQTEDTGTMAFSFTAPFIEERNDFIAAEMRKCGSALTLHWWYPARLWWAWRWTSILKNPPKPVIPQ
jgi:hypothetical protein